MVRPVAFRRALGAAFMLALLAPPGAGAHETRHTTPLASSLSGTCSAALPCRIDHAINAAGDGDEVVAPGTYAITIPLDAPAIALHGSPGSPRPCWRATPISPATC